MKNKTTAGLIALLLGNIGGHKFYLDDTGTGLLYLIFCWTFIPGIIAFFEAIGLFMMDEKDFNQKYNQAALSGSGAQGNTPQQMGQNVTVNLEGAQGSNVDVADQLEKLQNLKDSGTLSEEEFQEQKRKLLTD